MSSLGHIHSIHFTCSLGSFNFSISNGEQLTSFKSCFSIQTFLEGFGSVKMKAEDQEWNEELRPIYTEPLAGFSA